MIKRTIETKTKIEIKKAVCLGRDDEGLRLRDKNGNDFVFSLEEFDRMIDKEINITIIEGETSEISEEE